MYQKFFFLLISVVSIANCDEIHKSMTSEEVQSVFQTTHDNVPQYEVVAVQHKPHNGELNSQQIIKFNAFNEELQLNLEPTEGYLVGRNTPLWTVKSNADHPEGLEYKLIPNAMNSLVITYHDVVNMAAISAMLTPDEKILFDGSIGSDLVVRPLPERVLNDVIYGENSTYEAHHMNNQTDGDFVHTHHHVVYKRQAPEGKQPLEDFMIPDIPSQYKSSRAKRNLPDVIYPQLLIVIDYNEYRAIGQTVELAIKYVISFFNAVDLRFRSLSNPRIRFNIAGIIIALDTDAVPYIDTNFDGAFVKANHALGNMSTYFYREKRFSHSIYDMVVTLTQLELCNPDITYNNCHRIRGHSFLGGACNWNDTKNNTEGVAIIQDNGGFSGILTASLEIGHLLGTVLDNDPGSNCSDAILSGMNEEVSFVKTISKLSNCSVNTFLKFLSEDRAQCLHNPPPPDRKVPRVLPGKLMSLDQLCKKACGTRALNHDETVCSALECDRTEDTYRYTCSTPAPAPEGSRCGDGMICLNKNCIFEGYEGNGNRTSPNSPGLNLPVINSN